VELFDFRLQMRARHTSVTDMAVLDPEDAVSHITEGIESVIAESGVDRRAILGVGVGVPGLVEHREDAVVHGQSVGWHAVPLEAMLRSRTGLPILVDNCAKTLGQAEKWFGAARGTDNAVIALLGIGVGTCIISNGEVYQGATGSAGEWGHTKMVVGGRTCRCGAEGCIEAYVGAGAIAARYEQLKGRKVTTSPGELEGRVTAIIDAAGRDPAAAQVLEETVTYLGAGIADLVNLFNPERVAVGGWLGQALSDALLSRVREAAGRHALHLPFSRVEIVKADLGKDAVALGGATLPIARLLAAGAVVTEPADRRRTGSLHRSADHEPARPGPHGRVPASGLDNLYSSLCLSAELSGRLDESRHLAVPQRLQANPARAATRAPSPARGIEPAGTAAGAIVGRGAAGGRRGLRRGRSGRHRGPRSTSRSGPTAPRPVPGERGRLPRPGGCARRGHPVPAARS
jgi:predicted NBD/HSP70 family sugar kinase